MQDSTSTQGQPLNGGKATRPGKLRACAECRRLKLRCDRKFPCQACIRRGCSALCPDKCFTDEATPSSLKASSLRSREEIQSLKKRVAALEEALTSAQPSHTLLAHNQSPISITSYSTSATREDRQGTVEETIDIFGTLSIGENGSTVFHGATSMAENFVKKSSSGATDRRNLLTGDQPVLPPTIQLLNVLFPFAPHSVSANSDINEFLPYLPPAAEALAITDLYWHHFSMGSASICRQHFLNKIYNHFYPHNSIKSSIGRSDAHRLGVLFITLALGVLTDLNKPMLSTEAEMYHQLARASLSLDPLCDNTTIHGIQCMLSINWYMRSAPVRTTPGYVWTFNGIMLKLASSIGIFRDSRRWLNDMDEIEQREVLCWELTCIEVAQAFAAGRPCYLNLRLMDCQTPPASATTSAGLPGFIPGFTDWKYRFYPLVSDVLEVVQRPGPVKYSEIMKLERQLRDCEMPEELVVPLNSSPLDGLPDNATTKHLQRFTALIIKETTCCLLHRRFLVLAIQKDSEEPRRNPFYYSAFQAGYSAISIVNSHIAMYRRHPELISRTPAFWSTSFSAAVILGAIVARYWNRDFAQGTLRPFEQICALFQEASETSIQPFNALEILQRLQQRVRAKFPTSLDAAENFDDIPLLGGHPLIAQQPPAPPPTTAPPSAGRTYSDHTDICAALAFSELPPTDAEDPELGFTDAGAAGLWPVPDILMQGTNMEVGGLSPLLWPHGLGQPLSDGVSSFQFEGSMMVAGAASPSGGEVGQWNQFLERLQVWE